MKYKTNSGKVVNKKKVPTFEALPDYSTFKSWKVFVKRIYKAMCAHGHTHIVL